MSKYLQVIDDLLTRDECKQLIEFAEKQGFKEVDRGIANYHRVEFDNPLLANLLCNRLIFRNMIPQYWNGNKVVGLNTHFRFSKYYEGQEFGIHKDGFNTDQNGNRSVMTLNIFLNDDFEGGETDFFYEDKSFRFSAKPKSGRASLFDSQQYHCGNKIKKGIKYLLRTDVMVSAI